MKDKILRFARGDFGEAQSNIILSESQITLDVEEGRRHEGSLYIGNDGGVMMKGFLYSECPHLSIKEDNFTGKEASVGYTFSADDIQAGETVKGDIVIVSNCGEMRIPVCVSVILPAITLDEAGKISDLTAFTSLAKENYREALKVFTDKDFSRILLYRDDEKKLIYETLVDGSRPIVAMEEFLVAIHKKTRVIFDVDRNNVNYDNCYAPFEDEVILQASSWGCINVTVRSDSGFIKIETGFLWTNDYPSGKIPVKYIIDSDKMSSGINKGKISIFIPGRTIEVNVTAQKYETEEKYRPSDVRKMTAKIVRGYIERRKGDMTEDSFIKLMEETLEEYRNKCRGNIINIVKMYIAAMKYKTDISDEMIRDTDDIARPDEDAPPEGAVLYAALCYIRAISAPAESKQALVDRAASEIRYMYDNGFRNIVLFWFLINIESRYDNPRTLFYDILEYIKNGCTSPALYIEFCLVIKRNPELMHEWHPAMAVPLAWGVRNNLFDSEMALAYTFHVSRIKEYNYAVYSSLDLLYDKFGLDEIVSAVCTMLIRAQKYSTRYLKWYGRGIKNRLMITGIYETYMYSLPGGAENNIPEQVMRYFMYDNRLPKREKQMLYASVIQAKKKNPLIYKAYTVMIDNFARKQLERGSISDAMSVIYEDSIKLSSVDETIASMLPEVMFKHKIECSRPEMKYVSIRHREFEGEQTEQFVNGTAYIDIYSDNYCIVLVDSDGNRHIGQDYYTMKKMLHFDSYAEKCYEKASDNKKLLKYMYYKCEREFHLNKNAVKIRRSVRRGIRLRKSYKRKNLSTLMQYYYDYAEGEYLDELLTTEDFGDTDRAARQKWIEMLIVRGLGERALDAVCTYGYDGIDVVHLARICDEALLQFKDGTSDFNLSLLDIAFYIFKNGEYTENIIRYLARYYTGPCDSMFEIWKAARGFGIDKKEIEEKLLTTLLFVEGDTKCELELLESYIENGKDKTLKKGCVSYLSYKYLLEDAEISDIIWDWIENNILTEYNVVCTLAILKRLSRKGQLSESEIKFCDVKLCQMIQKGIVFPFFTDFSKYIRLPDGLSNKAIIMCVAKPGINVHMRYKVRNSSIICTEMIEVFAGVYVREIVVFRDEEIVYGFYTEKNSRKHVLGSGKAEYKYVQSDEISRYLMINKMIEHYDNRNLDDLYSCMETYIKLDEASHNLFELL